MPTTFMHRSANKMDYYFLLASMATALLLSLLDLFLCLFHYSYPQAKLQGSQLSPGSSTGESWVEVKPLTHCLNRFRCLVLWKSRTSPPTRNLAGWSPPWPFSSPSTLPLSSSPSAGCGPRRAGCSGEHWMGEGAGAVASTRRTEPWRRGEGSATRRAHRQPRTWRWVEKNTMLAARKLNYLV